MKNFRTFFRISGRLRKISKEKNLEKTRKFWKRLREQMGSLETNGKLKERKAWEPRPLDLEKSNPSH